MFAQVGPTESEWKIMTVQQRVDYTNEIISNYPPGHKGVGEIIEHLERIKKGGL